MKISARNQLKGTVSAIAEGAVNGVVSIDLGSTMVKADITMEAINDLGLKEGTDAMAIIKASNVMFAAGSERIQGISARNQIAGTIASVKKGAVNGHVAIETPGGRTHHGASITNEAIEDLGSRRGVLPRSAIVKSTTSSWAWSNRFHSICERRSHPQGRVLHAALLHFRIPFPFRALRGALFPSRSGPSAQPSRLRGCAHAAREAHSLKRTFRLPQNNLTL